MALLPNRDSAKAADRKAKTQAAQDEALLREVDDAVRTDQYRHVWTRYGIYIIGVVLLGLLAFAAVLFFSGQSEGNRESESETLVTALDQVEAGNLDQADEALAPLAEDGRGGGKTQAQMLRAGIALEQGREVMAVPGSPLDPRARGCNRLIKDGAHLVEEASDLLDLLGPAGATTRIERPGHRPGPARPAPAYPPEALEESPATAAGQVLALLSPEPQSVDEVIRQCQLSAALVGQILLELELAGRAERHPGNRISLVAAGSQ